MSRYFDPAAFDQDTIADIVDHFVVVQDLSCDAHRGRLVDVIERRIDAARKQAVTEAAQWVVGFGYPIEVTMPDTHPPADLWEAIIDVAHADTDGHMHGNELTRDEVDSWLRDEAGLPDTNQEDQ